MTLRNKEVKILGIIPARGGSKGIPYKNITPVGGKPLIYYTIREAKKSRLLDAFVVSTDDPKIASVARAFGADVPFFRPKKFARDNSPDMEFLKHALAWLEKNRGWHPEIIVNLRPTSPLRRASDIDRALKLMLDTGCDSVRTVSMPSNNPFKMWHIDKSNLKIRPFVPTKHFASLGTDVPRQWLPEIFWQNGMVDVTRAKFIRRGKIYGPDIRGVVINPERAVDVNNHEDLEVAEALLKKPRLA